MTNTELKKIRKERNLSKGELAKFLGITPMLLGRYEKGSCAIPDEVAEKLQANADGVVATEIEVKKKTRKGGRKAKEKAAEIVAEVKETVGEKAIAAEIEVKKTARKGARKAKETVKAVAGEKKTAVLIQSQLGGTITPEDILSRVPADVDSSYIKPEENKAYWVRGDESGSVELW